MNKRVIVLFTFLFVLLSLAGQSFPNLSGRVVDQANIFNSREESSLNSLLIGLEKDANIQAVVVSVKSLQGYPVEDYTIRLAERWQIGTKKSDNGVIVLIAPNERDVRIEVGYGLEHKLTDGMSGYIIRKDIIPNFSDGSYYRGVVAGLTTINNIMTGKTTITEQDIRESEEKSGSSLGYIIFMVIIAILFRGRLLPMLLFGSLVGNNRGGRGGGFGGFGGGGFSGGGGGFGGGGASGKW